MFSDARKVFTVLAIAFWCFAGSGAARASFPPVAQGDVFIPNFRFHDGSSINSLHIHYYTLGTPVRDSFGNVRNAVLIHHGTNGSGAQFLTDAFAGTLFNPGQTLDAAKYFIILPDGIGHGKSSQPKDGLHANFPHYDYDDTISAEFETFYNQMGINHFRLLIGTSMGCSMAWRWAELVPNYWDAVMPVACFPYKPSGKLAMYRKMGIDTILHDPQYANGEYTSAPLRILENLSHLNMLEQQNPHVYQVAGPDLASATKIVDDSTANFSQNIDLNNSLYANQSALDYDPGPLLGSIKAPLYHLNFFDDQIVPPDTGIMELVIPQVPSAHFSLMPEGPNTRGHTTLEYPALWDSYIKTVLGNTTPAAARRRLLAAPNPLWRRFSATPRRF